MVAVKVVVEALVAWPYLVAFCSLLFQVVFEEKVGWGFWWKNTASLVNYSTCTRHPVDGANAIA